MGKLGLGLKGHCSGPLVAPLLCLALIGLIAPHHRVQRITEKKNIRRNQPGANLWLRIGSVTSGETLSTTRTHTSQNKAKKMKNIENIFLTL